MTLWSPLLGPLCVPAVKSRRVAMGTSCLADRAGGEATSAADGVAEP